MRQRHGTQLNCRHEPTIYEPQRDESSRERPNEPIKAKKELGYDPRSAREGLARSCRWFLDNGYVSKKAARRARLELQPS